MQTNEDYVIVNELEAKLKLSKLVIDESNDHVLNKECDWVNSIVEELIAETQNGQENIDEQLAKVEVDLTVLRKHNNTFKDHLIITGVVKGGYDTCCVRCLEPMSCEFEHEFSTCFIPVHFDKTPEYEEATHIYTNDMELELYFHTKGIVELKELIHENVFMAMERFPLHTEDCKGLCHSCGCNLNDESCNCHKKNEK